MIMKNKLEGYRTSLPNNQSVRRSLAAAMFEVSEYCSYKLYIIDLVNRPEPSKLQKVEEVPHVSSCSCAIHLRRIKRQDLLTSG